jgi:hypothetical protein
MFAMGLSVTACHGSTSESSSVDDDDVRAPRKSKSSESAVDEKAFFEALDSYLTGAVKELDEMSFRSRAQFAHEMSRRLFPDPVLDAIARSMKVDVKDLQPLVTKSQARLQARLQEATQKLAVKAAAVEALPAVVAEDCREAKSKSFVFAADRTKAAAGEGPRVGVLLETCLNELSSDASLQCIMDAKNDDELAACPTAD